MRNNGWVLVLLFILVALLAGQGLAKKNPQKSRVQELIYGSAGQLSDVKQKMEEERVQDTAVTILPGRMD